MLIRRARWQFETGGGAAAAAAATAASLGLAGDAPPSPPPLGHTESGTAVGAYVAFGAHDSPPFARAGARSAGGAGSGGEAGSGGSGEGGGEIRALASVQQRQKQEMLSLLDERMAVVSQLQRAVARRLADDHAAAGDVADTGSYEPYDPSRRRQQLLAEAGL